MLKRSFGEELSGGWKAGIEDIIPSCDHSPIDDAALTKRVRADTAAVLGLQNF